MTTETEEDSIEFVPFPKIARLNRMVIVTEKIDGTNAAVGVTEDGRVYAQSRKRLIRPDSDNFGFAQWVSEHETELVELGPGVHFGEWWGQGIQRNYGLEERRFSLFNVGRWATERPACCEIVPVLGHVQMLTRSIQLILEDLRLHGSVAVPGFPDPEGIVVYHSHSNKLFKVTVDDDHKGAVNEAA